MSKKETVLLTLIATADIELDIIDKEGSDEEDDILNILFENLLLVVSSRYLEIGQPVPKSIAWFADVLPNLDEKRFKVMMRMAPRQFLILLEQIEDHPLFHVDAKQFPVSTQLAMTLFRLGSYGSGCSVAKMATLFGVGDGGTIERVVSRVFKVLLSYQSKLIYWPNPEEREQIVAAIGEDFPQCVGFLDGSEFNLAEASSVDHSSYYSRKQRYSIKAQVICDYDLKIRYLHVGYPGSTHYARIFSTSDIGLHPTKYLSNAQWLCADSAYKLSDKVITPFRSNSKFKTPRDRQRFNKYFSGYRVKIEQCFGILKEKFSSLKEIRTRIKDSDSHAFVCKWITVCCILHNILLPYYDPEDFNYETVADEEYEDPPDGADENVGENKRAALFSLLETKF